LFPKSKHGILFTFVNNLLKSKNLFKMSVKFFLIFNEKEKLYKVSNLKILGADYETI